MLRPLPLDCLTLLLPLAIGFAVLFFGLYQGKLPRWVNGLFLVIALITIAGGAASAANFFPDNIHDAISYMGGATILLCIAALMLLGFAWSVPNLRFTNAFMASMSGICFVLLAIDGSGPLWWRYGSPESWERFPNEKGWLRQSSGLTCSPTAAAMMLFGYGIQASEGEMAYLGGTTLFGSDGPAMARALQTKVHDKGWLVHTGKTTLEEVLERKIPFLAHIRGQSYGHAVFVLFIHDNTVHYLDPAIGEPRAISVEEFQKVWDQTATWIEIPAVKNSETPG